MTQMASASGDSAAGGTPQNSERPPNPLREHDPRPLKLLETLAPIVQEAGSPEVLTVAPSTPQVPTLPDGVQTPELSPSSPIRLSKAQKFKAKRAAKKRAQQEAREEMTTRPEVTIEAS